MKKLLVLLIVVAFVCTAFVAVAQDKGPAVIKMDKAKTGVVTFDHAKHQVDAPDCAACHHTDGFEKCSSCHRKSDSKEDVKKYKKAIHDNCKGCHKKEGKGPTKCKGCHVK
ncbi:MAG: cytochrome c3 family protein [Thermodesulfobacteriota bacterium]|nr:cytochrome c3 family protein [Thermodesulfobacteriota bacterium]